MIKSKEIIFIKRLFLILGHKEKCQLINDSSLTDIEKKIFMSRLIYGDSAKNLADNLNLSQDGYDRLQKKLYLKFYLWLTVHPKFVDYSNLVNYVAERNFISAVKI